MSQEIGPVTPCHAMSLVITLTKDCPSPQKVPGIPVKTHAEPSRAIISLRKVEERSVCAEDVTGSSIARKSMRR